MQRASRNTSLCVTLALTAYLSQCTIYASTARPLICPARGRTETRRACSAKSLVATPHRWRSVGIERSPALRYEPTLERAVGARLHARPSASRTAPRRKPLRRTLGPQSTPERRGVSRGLPTPVAWQGGAVLTSREEPGVCEPGSSVRAAKDRGTCRIPGRPRQEIASCISGPTLGAAQETTCVRGRPWPDDALPRAAGYDRAQLGLCE
jgi:hypothetical protein